MVTQIKTTFPSLPCIWSGHVTKFWPMAYEERSSVYHLLVATFKGLGSSSYFPLPKD